MPRSVTTTGRARGTVQVASSVLVAVTVLAGSPAGGQEEDAGPTTTAPSSTTTTAPPTTVVLEDGDIGVIPPGADEETTTTTTAPPGDEDPLAPDTDEVPVDEELPVVVLPDPTPGLNAALAEIDVSRARDELAAGDDKRREAEAALADAFATRRAVIDARRAAGEHLLATKAVLDQLAVTMVVRGDLDALRLVFGEASLDDLRERELVEVAGAKVQADFEAARAAYRVAVDDEIAATQAVEIATAAERDARGAYLGLRRAVDEAIAAAEQARRQIGPAVLGPTVLGTEDLVAWYRTYYRVDPPVAPIEDIIAAYLRVGEEEEVAGDIAFAQAILETGGFRSGHARGFNFAGIGAFDHCSPGCGFRFPDLDEGVRAHIHLLRAYADPDLTTAQLAATPNRLVAPERVGVRGCCQRWTELTGVWATDPNYDRKVLGIYRLMVETARARDRAEI